ncbi:GroES-like protein [Zopfia rhizophila CBS 207.26]|uniref:GroES-like protein n=1 Tax=Zopfia rhizophila CBS 207.26 TaxID=1314779 RepID=A0A6A6DRF0_9PEZI|nr:GroES-like protein [Zopfia rhizophila CBS 207.26]
MAEENVKYIVQAKGRPLEAATSPKPTKLQPSEIMIRLKAVAINPADVKMIDDGHRVASYPFVAGLDGAGIIEAVGDEVKNFNVGEEVLGWFAANDRGGSFQRFAVVDEWKVARKPESWSFEEAATLSVCYATAVAALGIGLKTPLCFIKGGASTGFTPSSVLVLGGSSALGAAVIQLLRLAVPDCRIFSTSSPKHHNHIVKTLGADEAFDRSSATLAEDVKSVSPRSRGVDAIVDVVGAGGPYIFDTLNADGPRRYAQVWTGDEEIKVPYGVESVLFRSRDLAQVQGGENIMLSLQTVLEESKYKLPLPVHKVGDGFDALEKGLEIMRKGVSGEKLVVTV